MSTPLFIGSEIYRGSSYGPQHPLAIPRVPTVIDLCRAMGWLPREQYRTSPRAKPAALHAFHAPTYIEALQRAEATGAVDAETRKRHQIGTLSNPVFPEIFRRPATAAGGSLLAAELIAPGGVVYNPGGGTHHGMADRAGGFCYLNDPVLAIKALLGQGLSRIAYVDIDAHHCDGVAAAFHGEPRVMMISTHEEKRWPFTGTLDDDAGGNAINLPLPRATNDSGFAMALERVILPAVQAQRPEAIVLQCGADAVTEDPLSRLAMSNNAHWACVAALKGMAPRLLVLGGGGYNPWTVGRLWAGVWATLNGADMPDRLPGAARAVLEGLGWTRRRGERPDHLLNTMRDAPRPGPIPDDLRRRVQFLEDRRRVWV
ncbi:acetoin utilization protein AcuC [Lutimaribacter sp. EGI FJ00015]|uniref:Acetoin utilization protein AcuC n=1 Tax=Lutimaribacter degradans TaxID=2945989 RepID=A0ACC5ZY38_9RHOB|nr:acetoin utilization protein AcuC [Lutimaribacter sp. EGI FJ00013]MCM2563222.1 acetoin utilization protein AcuC [Lutimaribacter sp. EGI FJ00013]MCO0614455.1 acetoin utilization protein AcuC [Lutimaribacter sp. EGI FJ00015]MCO0635944.1 acetoin utilization protein AcuC [Lutimaribacter sp. EGI FJ00014]